MRIKVVLGKDKLVIPLSEKDSGQKVQQLYEIVANRFKRRGKKDLRIASLETVDGFSLDLSDVVSSVIVDGDILVAFDYADWIAAKLPLCTGQWVRTVQEDFVDNVPKFIAVGKADGNSLYVKLGTGYPGTKSERVKRLELFDTESLSNYGKPGKTVIASEGGASQGNATWKLEASFNVGTNGRVTDLEFAVQSSSDKRPVIKKIAFSVNSSGELEKGQTTMVQEDAMFDPTPIAKPASFTKKQTGPTLVQCEKIPVEKATKKTSGNANLEISQTHDVYIAQSWERGGKFNNIFETTFSLLNKSKSEISLRAITSKYMNKQNQWLEAKTNVQDYGSGTIKLQAEDSTTLTVSAIIEITAPQYENLRRAHKSLPNPIKLQYTFEEVNGTKSEIVVQSSNPPYDFPNQEQIKSNLGGEPLEFWGICDDTELEIRLFCAAAVGPGKTHLRVCNGGNNTNKYIYRSDLKQYAWNAAQQNVTEIEISELKFDKSGMVSKVYAVIDKPTGRCFCLKFDMKTTTSSLVDYCMIPHLEEYQ